MADHTQGRREPDEEGGSFSLGRRATHDEFVEEPLHSGLGELFVSEEALDFEEFDGLEDEDSLLEDFDEQDLEAFFDPEEEVEGIDQLRAELLDEDVLPGAEADPDALARGADGAELASHAPQGGPDRPHPPRAVPDALGSVFSELGDAERAESDGQDAWALDQVVEEGMSWLMELGDGEPGEGAALVTRSEAGAEDRDDWTAIGTRRSARVGRRGLVAMAWLALLAVGGTFGYRELFPGRALEPQPVARPKPARPPLATPEGGAAPELEAIAQATGTGSTETAATEPASEAGEPLEDPPSTVDPADPLLGPQPFAGPATDLRDPFLALSQAGDALPPGAGLPFLVAHFTSTTGVPRDDPSAGTPPAEGTSGAPEPDAVVVTVDPSPERESRGQRLGPEDMVLLPESDLPFRLASADDLRGVWPGATIPVDRIEAPERLLTPSVGRVRVVLNQGEVFDGLLYAVGEKKVWLEFSGGRMALISWQIEKIEHLDGTADSPELGATDSSNMVGLDRVRVRTPGGVFYGKLLNRDGHRVTLLTSDGARITLEHAEVEPAGRSRTRIIDTTGVDPDALSQAD